MPVDAAGLQVELLDGVDADAVVVTAAHQYPVGGVLPADRRAALVAWAERRNGIIVEDDYDAEFRYDRAPIGTLQGLCPDHVVYAGSASKILAPGLRLGWLIAPARLVPELAAAKLAADMGSGALDQLAFADVVERGELDHHLRRMRPIYRRRRDVLLAALARELPSLRPTGISAGLHVLAWLPPELDEGRIVAAALAAGIGISGLGARRIGAGARRADLRVRRDRGGRDRRRGATAGGGDGRGRRDRGRSLRAWGTVLARSIESERSSRSSESG